MMTRPAESPRRSGRLGSSLVGVLLVAALRLLFDTVAAPAGAQDVAPPAVAGEGWVRLGHFAPGTGPIDVLVDGAPAVNGVGPGSVTRYVRVAAGPHQVQAVASGSPGSAPLIDLQAGVPANGSVTVGVVTTRDGIGVQVYEDSLENAAEGRALVRFIHTVPDIAAVDIAVVDGPVLASEVAYPESTPYLDVTPGTYDIEVRAAGTSEVLLRVDAWAIDPGTEATVVVNRNVAGSLSVVPLLDAEGAAVMPMGGASTGMGGLARGAPATAGVSGALMGSIMALIAGLGAVLILQRAGSKRTMLLTLSVATLGLSACGSRSTAEDASSSVSGDRLVRSTTTAPTGSTTTVPAPSSAAPVASGANVNTETIGAPLGIRVESLGIEASLVELGVALDGSVEVPQTADQAGWFREGPRPGEVGAAVVLGHVDSASGPGVFMELSKITEGAEVVVSTDTGDVRFVADRVEQVPKDEFPTGAVYSSVPEPALRLITCGGSFDRSTGHYRDNVVVYLHRS